MAVAASSLEASQATGHQIAGLRGEAELVAVLEQACLAVGARTRRFPVQGSAACRDSPDC